MSEDLDRLSDEQLRELASVSRLVLSLLSASLAAWPNMRNAVQRLMSPDDTLETFYELAAKEPDLMRTVLEASVAAFVNAKNLETVDEELKRRTVDGN